MSNNNLRGLASIIVPCWNQLEFTQQCLAALKSHTRPPWELIVVDNGSTDGTGAYLAGVRDMAIMPVTLVSNATKVGFPAAINQGLQLARGEYLVLLNNDVVVSDGWLDQLVALATAKLGTENDFTAKRAKNAKEEREERGESAFGCGPANGSGVFTSIDSAADGGAWPAEAENPHERGALSSLPTAYCLPPTPKSGGLSSLPTAYRLPQTALPHCLESVRGVFDEIVVVDTGSTDRTVEIARSFGAKVFPFVWVDDFAAARNEALAHATGDYVFWLDADDVVEPAEREKLSRLLASLRRPTPTPPRARDAGLMTTSTPRPALGAGFMTPPESPTDRSPSFAVSSECQNSREAMVGDERGRPSVGHSAGSGDPRRALGADPHPIPLPRRERAMTYLGRRALGRDRAFLLRSAMVS